jgi:hypothetical protein
MAWILWLLWSWVCWPIGLSCAAISTVALWAYRASMWVFRKTSAVDDKIGVALGFYDDAWLTELAVTEKKAGE